MDLIRESALFTTVLHCVLAYSLPSNNLAQTTEPYNTISHSYVTDILQKPSYHKELQTEATNSFVSGRNDKMAYEVKTNHALLDDIMKNIKQFFQPELPDTTPKGIESKYPLTTPRVKINFASNSGLLPVKIHTSLSDKSEPAKVLQSTSIEKSTKPMNDKGDLRIRPTSSKPVEYDKQEMIPLDYLTTPTSQNGLDFSQNNFHVTQSEQKPDLSGILLNPIFHQTNPGIDVRKDQIDKPFQYTLPGLVSHPYSTLPGISRNVESVGNNQFTSTFKPDYATDALTANFPTNLDTYVSARADEYTASYGYVPKIASKQHVSKEGNLHDRFTQSTTLYKESPAINVPKTPKDYSPTKPIGEEVVLPPVPTSLSALQRVQIALLNTVSGLPGGIEGALEAVRAK